MKALRKSASYVVLVGTYCLTWVIAVVGRMIPRRRWKPNGRILVTGTLFNPNWLLSHIVPLTRCGTSEVILVIDAPMQPLEGVRYVCPPKWLAKLVSRAGAKALWVLYAGIRYRPDLFMGYNLVAGGCTALVAGALLGRPSCYQMTGGYLVLSTIGVEHYEAKQRPPWRERLRLAIERLAVSVIRKFDLVVVRGNKTKAFLANYGIKDNVAIITGSVKENPDAGQGGRDIDLIFVGRLNPIKQVDQFIRIVSGISDSMPSVRAAIVGSGALKDELQAYARQLGVQDNVEFWGKRKDIEAILARAKVFILTSKSEGLSIALAEAMMAGAVPVVANVGELGDLVCDGVCGYLIKPNAIESYVERSLLLLQDDRHRRRLSDRARETTRQYTCLDVVSEKWRHQIKNTIEHAAKIQTDTEACCRASKSEPFVYGR